LGLVLQRWRADGAGNILKLQCSNSRSHAFTLTEVLVILAVIAVLAVMLIAATTPNRIAAYRIQCINNLKQIDLGFKLWSPGQSDKYPTQYPVKFGGCMELVATGNVAAVFVTMSNILEPPKILICPADTDRQWATNFATDFGNKNISYFVGINASEDNPNSILIGDDNFEISGTPIKPGVLEIRTNNSIAWTGERHKFWGNIGFADGSVQSGTSSWLTNAIIKQYDSTFGVFTNRFVFAIP